MTRALGRGAPASHAEAPAAPAHDHAAGDVVMRLGIVPSGLDRFLDLVGERGRPLIKYCEGSLTLVSPSYRHERVSKRIDYLIVTIGDVMGIGCLPAASTLFRRPGYDHGIEADQSYYLQNEAAVRGVDADFIDLAVYPPPDLMVEVVVTHGAKDSLRICQELEVPEVWVDYPREGRLDFLRLARRGPRSGTYVPAKQSLAFPFLKPADLVPWLQTAGGEPESDWRRRVREWVRGELSQRARPGGRG